MEFRSNPDKETVRVHKCQNCGKLFAEDSGSAPTEPIRNHGNEQHFPRWGGYKTIVGFPKEEL